VSALFGLVVAFDRSRLWWVVWFGSRASAGLSGVVSCSVGELSSVLGVL